MFNIKLLKIGPEICAGLKFVKCGSEMRKNKNKKNKTKKIELMNTKQCQRIMGT